jgi:hypothetical protein
LGSDDAKGGGDFGSGGVSVSEPVDIGPVTAVVLTGETGEAVNAWLSDNGFVLPAESQSLVDEYSGSGRYFIALRRSATTAPGGPTSVGIHFTLPGDQRWLPLRFASLGAADTVAFTVFVAADGPSGPSLPFETLTLDDLDAGALRASGYATAVREAVAEREGRAFVVEGIYDKADVAGISTSLDALLDSGQSITRLSTIIDASTLDADVGLNTAFSGNVPTERHVRLERAFGPNGTPLAAALALAGAIVLRRRR